MSPAFAVVDDVEVFVEGGGATSLVMVHGWPDTWRLWDAQVAFFRDRYRCVRFTLPGFDIAQPVRAWTLDQMVATLRRIVQAACPEGPVVLMLHDWGCLFGRELLMRHPMLATRLIMVDVGDSGSAAHRRSLTLPHKLMIFGYQAWLAVAWRIGGGTGDRMTRWMARRLRCPADAAFIGAQMNFPYYILWTGRHGGYRQALAFAAPCPMLFVYGTRKPFMFHSPAWLETLRQRAGCAVVALRTGHWVMRNDAQAFNQAVQRWLDA